MNKKITYAVGIFLLSICGWSCSDEPSGKAEYPESPKFTSEDTRSIHIINDFSLNLISQAAEEWNEENVDNHIISPLGVMIDLSMLANGASDQAQNEILNVLNIGNKDLQSLNATMKKICMDLPHDSKVSTIGIANGLWSDNTLSLNSNYAESLKSIFNTSLTRLGDNKIKDLEDINSWVRNNTFGMIPDFSKNLNPDLKMLIANVIYLNANWKKPFEESNTKPRSFHNVDGTVANVMMMSGKQYVSEYYEDKEGGIFIKIEYKNANIGISIYMPAKYDRMKDVCDYKCVDGEYHFNNDEICQAGTANIVMPKFEFNDEHELIDIIKSLGITSVFEPNGFSGIMSDNESEFRIQNIDQQLVFSIDEKGAKASAVTYNKGDLSVLETVPSEIIIDRPFMFKVEAYGLTLLAGQIAKF